MGNIYSIYKIYPEDAENIDFIESELKKGFGEPFEVREIKIEPIAFGLKLIKVAFVFPDKIDGLLDKLENSLKAISGVREIECEMSTLL